VATIGGDAVDVEKGFPFFFGDGYLLGTFKEEVDDLVVCGQQLIEEVDK
jgi:hypothetical protein